MWSSRRQLLAGACALALSACAGYSPVLAPGGPAAGLHGQVAVQAPETVDDYALVSALESRLGQSATGRYRLDYTLAVKEVPVGITPSQETTRYNVTGQIDWTLTDSTTGGVVTSGAYQSFTSYAATGSTVAGLSAQEDAHKRLMQLIADEIVSRLTATAGDWRR